MGELSSTNDRFPGRRSKAGGARHQDPARWAVGFWSLIVTQFQGAFNDNALKFLVIYLVVDLGLPQQQRDWLVLVVGALFALPFILFSMTGGFLADRYSKRSVTIATKWLELAAMSFALVALARGSFLLETIGVFVISSQAALFGPSKYGLLPEMRPAVQVRVRSDVRRARNGLLLRRVPESCEPTAVARPERRCRCAGPAHRRVRSVTAWQTPKPRPRGRPRRNPNGHARRAARSSAAAEANLPIASRR